MNETLQELLHHIKGKAYIDIFYVDIVDECADYFTLDELNNYGHYKVNSWELDLETNKLTLEIEGK